MNWSEWDTKEYALLASWLIAGALLIRLWRSSESTVIKVGLTAIAPIPILGPLLILWISNFPNSAPAVLQDRSRYGTDVYERWAGIFKEKNPNSKFRKWLALVSKSNDQDL